MGMPPAALGIRWPKFVGTERFTRVGVWFLDFRENDEATVAA
jgi:hypothetical protein